MDTRMPEVPITPPVQVVPTTRSGVRARHHKHFLEGFFAIFLAIQGPVEYTYYVYLLLQKISLKGSLHAHVFTLGTCYPNSKREIDRGNTRENRGGGLPEFRLL